MRTGGLTIRDVHQPAVGPKSPKNPKNPENPKNPKNTKNLKNPTKILNPKPRRGHRESRLCWSLGESDLRVWTTVWFLVGVLPVAEKTYLFRAPYYDFYIESLRKVGLFGYRYSRGASVIFKTMFWVSLFVISIVSIVYSNHLPGS